MHELHVFWYFHLYGRMRTSLVEYNNNNNNQIMTEPRLSFGEVYLDEDKGKSNTATRSISRAV